MSELILFNKPFRVMSQFTDDQGRATLADYIKISGIYPAGRLDYDSEGLMALTDDGKLQSAISHPQAKRSKTYWVQVDGDIDEAALAQLRRGVDLKDGPTLPAEAQRIEEPKDLWPRQPPVRYRANIPTSWLQLTITEGRNRQVRRMTAAVGFPTLRLVRAAIGDWQLGDLPPGQYRRVSLSSDELKQLIPPPRPASRPGQKRGAKKRYSSGAGKGRPAAAGRRGRVGK
ncbi:pseudouridine synthase [Spongiibacter nanhainus]|uniref:Pseudouridine synthase n=1 Tax=Spongiibacter nanhainus TaxID=2794344 RepID=A0A7T4URS0_9GAMM|nr:pseudouridine synthase [Spongiibacter nanhainus]QQD20001.1 pseudouridine synthase [Spongiibacter nanhainus]